MDLMSRRRILLAQSAQESGVLATATGNPMTFTTDLVRRLHSLVIPFSPVQAAGTPSPDNPLPISGWTGANAFDTGINVWDEEWEEGTINVNNGNNQTGTTYWRTKNYIPVKPNTAYLISTAETNKACRLRFYDKDKGYIGSTPASGTGYSGSPFTTPANAYFLRFAPEKAVIPTPNGNVSVNYPASDTSYHAYHAQTLPINWQTEAGTIYGGTVTLNEDGSADVVATHAEADLGNLRWVFMQGNSGIFFQSMPSDLPLPVAVVDVAYDMFCENYKTVPSKNFHNIGAENNTILGRNTMTSVCVVDNRFTTVEDFKAAVSGVKLVYPLATPGNPIHIPNVGSLYTYLGTNTIWTDTNGMNTAEYWIKNT